MRFLKEHLSYFALMALKYFKLHYKNGSVWHNVFLFVKNISKWTFTCSLYTCKIHFCMSEANWIITTNKKFLPQIYVYICQTTCKPPSARPPSPIFIHVHGIDFQLHVPGIAIDMRTANLIGISGVVFTWQYSSVMWFRLVTTTHSSFPVFS